MKNLNYHKGPSSSFWDEVQRNPLSKSYFVEPHQLQKIRVALLIPNLLTSLISLGFGLVTGNTLKMFLYLTMWGVFCCSAYFVGVLWVKDEDDSGIKWKIVYVLGELTACMEFLICPFFWIVLFPLLYDQMDALMIFWNVMIHLVVSVSIWIEILLNHIQFPDKHKIFLAVLGVSYGMLNWIWTTTQAEIYPLIDWVSWQSWALCLVAAMIAFAGFQVGKWQYRWKQAKFTKPDMVEFCSTYFSI